MCFEKRIKNNNIAEDIIIFSYFQMKFPQIHLLEKDDFLEKGMLYIYRINKNYLFLVDTNYRIFLCKTERCKYFSIYSRDDIFRMLCEYEIYNYVN